MKELDDYENSLEEYNVDGYCDIDGIEMSVEEADSILSDYVDDSDSQDPMYYIIEDNYKNASTDSRIKRYIYEKDFNESYEVLDECRSVVSVYKYDVFDTLKNFKNNKGIEIMYCRDSLEDLNVSWMNWNNMSSSMKRISDKKSMDIFGISNEEHYNDLLEQF